MHDSGNTLLFPPALVPLLRQRIEPHHPVLAGVSDVVLRELVTVTFFAGLGTYEASWHPVRVVFTGRQAIGMLVPDARTTSSAPIYRWKALRFDTPRAFSTRELVKLAVAGADDRMYVSVRVADGRLLITGLAREGVNVSDDPFLKLMVTRPGELSIRSGADRILDYERGSVTTRGDRLLFTPGVIRRGLEQIGRSGGIEADALPEFLDVIKALLREMSAHGRGGMLIISPDERPELPSDSPYRMTSDSSLGALIRIAQLLGRSAPRAEAPHVEPPPGQALEPAPAAVAWMPSTQVLRSAFLTETERTIKEIGALTAIDGATILNRQLALAGFGVSLPVVGMAAVREARDLEGRSRAPFDFGALGTRHRAGVSYAAGHPGSVVFVVSQDGPVSCAFRASLRDEVVVWRLDQTDIHGR